MKRVDHDGRGSLQIRFPFDRALVDRIKRLPTRRWHANERFWSVPEADAIELVELLTGAGFAYDEATCDLYRALGGTIELSTSGAPASVDDLPLFSDPARADTAAASDSDLSVGALNQRVHELLAGAFDSTVWLVGEISGFDKSAHRKHVGFELVERDEDGRTVSKIAAILFESTRREIERELKRAGDPLRLEDEILVRFAVRVDLYVPWGQYRVVIERLDLNYTLGEAARRREEIVRLLTAEGLHERNRALPLPALPLRVGLITSLGSDAYNDLLRTLSEARFAFAVTVHGARVQGQATESSVLNALDWFAARSNDFDVVLICRGGGSRTDLIWFDSEPLGRAVANFPLPIVVGIGHEQDQSVLDALARSCKTPTAAAQLLVDRVEQALEQSESLGRQLLQAAARRIEGEWTGLERIEGGLGRSARAAIGTVRERLSLRAHQIPTAAQRLSDRAREALTRIQRSLGPAAGRGLELERERMTARQRRLHLIDPRRVLERGYAILRRADSSVLVEATRAEPGESLVAELRSGRLAVTATGPVTGSNGD